MRANNYATREPQTTAMLPIRVRATGLPAGTTRALFGRAPVRAVLAGIAIVAVLACGSIDAVPGAPGLDDPIFPLLGNGGYDVIHYAIELDVDVEKNVVVGITTIDAVATHPLGAFNLDYRGPEISSIEVDSKIAAFIRDGDELTVTAFRPLFEGDFFRTVVSYEGTPGSQRFFASDFLDGWVPFFGGIYALGEPTGSSFWYPVNEHPLDKATYSFRITVPEPFEVAANGLPGEVTADGVRRTYEWRTDDPMASYLVTVVIARFDEEFESGPGDLPIRNYFQKGVSEEARAAFDRIPEMIEAFSELFGPYPFETYGAIVIDANMPALETQTRSTFGVGIVEGVGEVVAAHELAHQWFGNVVTPGTWRDTWLNEGFATYAEWLWREHLRGPDALDNFWRSNYRRAFGPPATPDSNTLFAGTVYRRGAMTLHALRTAVGDATFFEILKTYVARFSGSNAVTADFVAVATEVSGQDLATLFDDWLYAPRTPQIPAPGWSPEPHRKNCA